jgi:hypothetical protein
MMIPKLNKSDKKRTLLKVSNLIGSPLFVDAIKELRAKWNITNVGLKSSEHAFHAKIIAQKSLSEFQEDVRRLTVKFCLPQRYEVVVYQYLFFNAIKHNIEQLCPIRILPLSENSDGERVIGLHLHGDTSKEDYLSAWPTVKKYLDGMMMTAGELNRRNFVRDKHFFQAKLNKPEKRDEDLADDYSNMTGDAVDSANIKVARKRMAHWVDKHKHNPYDGHAEDYWINYLNQRNPNMTAAELAKAVYKKIGVRKSPSEIKAQLQRYARYKKGLAVPNAKQKKLRVSDLLVLKDPRLKKHFAKIKSLPLSK